jgi:hypothetical protein
MNKTEFPSAFPQASQLKIKSIHAHSEYTLIFLSDRERWPEHKKSTAKERYFKMQHLYIPSFYYFLPERLRVTFFPTHLFYQYPFVSQHYFITILSSRIFKLENPSPFSLSLIGVSAQFLWNEINGLQSLKRKDWLTSL